jgi:hypothetical protein
MLLFTEPIAQDFGPPGFAPNAFVRPAISIGSPSGVPVPWASMYEMLSGAMPASACASAIASAWPSLLGAV